MSFLLKVKQFFKRNIYPITVSVCTVLVLSIITVSAYTSIKSSNEVVDTSQKVEEQTPTVSDKDQAEQVSPVPEKIIFDLPFDGATVSKEYSDTTLIYDATTKLWCTHQGLDFSCIEGQVAKAVYSGKVVKVENSMMNGTVVHLKVSDELTVVYKGLSSEVNVKEGDEVQKGANIGKITSFLTEKADGVHLHLEVLKGEKFIDPTEYFSFNK